MATDDKSNFEQVLAKGLTTPLAVDNPTLVKAMMGRGRRQVVTPEMQYMLISLMGLEPTLYRRLRRLLLGNRVTRPIGQGVDRIYMICFDIRNARRNARKRKERNDGL